VGNNYSVTFDSNGGSGTMDPEIFAYGSTKELTANGFSRTGYTFQGWDTASTGNTVVYADRASMTYAEDAIETATFYAVWAINRYTVSAVADNANCGTVNIAAVDDVPYGSIVTVSGSTLAVNGSDIVATPADPTEYFKYEFVGWSGYTEGMAITDATTFVAQFKAVLTKVDIDGPVVSVDADGLTSIELPQDVLQSVKDSGKPATVTLANGSISLDAASVSGLGTGAPVTFIIRQLTGTELTDAIREIAGDRPVFDISISDGATLDGTATVKLKYALQNDEDAGRLYVLYIADDGNNERIDCTYKDGYVSFTTTHFSDYAVMYEKPSSSDGGSTLLYVGIGAVAAIVLAGAAFFILKRKVKS
jgi:hypothetical protein